jgi:hypothetical protein
VPLATTRATAAGQSDCAWLDNVERKNVPRLAEFLTRLG